MARDPAGRPQPLLPLSPLLVIGALVVLRALAIASALLLGQWSSNRAFPSWIGLLQIAIFSGPALFLLISGRVDRRAWSLGIFFLDVACTIGEPFVRRWPDPLPLVSGMMAIRTDAFQGAMLCFFSAEFPRPPRSRRLALAYRTLYGLSLAIGVVLVIANAYPIISTTPLLRATAGWYFGVQYLLVPVLGATLFFKLRELEKPDRRRAYLLLWAIGGAAGALTLVVVLRGVIDLQLQGESATAWAVLFTLAVGILPAAATYAALVQRVLPVSVILRAAARYLLSKALVNAIATLPIIAIVLYGFVNRDRSLTDLLSGPTGILLILSAAAGAVLLIRRKTLLERIDRQFGRRPVQASGPLLDLAGVLRNIDNTAEFCDITRNAVETVFGPRSAMIFIADANGDLHSQQQAMPLLSRAGALAQMIGATDAPLAVSMEPGSPLARLHDGETAWLRQSEAVIIAPMRDAGGDLLGLITLSDRRSELPYSGADARALGAIGSTCGLALHRLREREANESTPGAGRSTDPPARECIECGLLYESTATACKCGAPLQRAAVPLHLRDELRFVRRVGVGGMGVVYEARDLAVHQTRAVKALPGTDSAMMARLRREARTMAAVDHANLATFYALTSWRSSPLLVMEFCGRGTLADQLRRGPLPIDEALLLSDRMCDALAHLHAHGIIHRDVKPSNIGFNDEMSPKLLDFGLAKMLDESLFRVGSNDGSTLSATLTESGGAIRGTPPYLSPEVLVGAAPAPGDDLWSLSVTLLEACTGTNPFRASTPAASAARVMVDDGRVSAATANLPGSVQTLIRTLLDRRPDRRPASAAELQRHIRQVYEGEQHVQIKTAK